MRRPLLWVVSALTVFLAFYPVLSQPNTCPEIVRQALFSLGNNCTGMERNTACYGFNRVDASFMSAMDAGFFSRPADRAYLSLIQRISTAPLDEALARWGIAVLHVQANVPDTLPGQAVTFMLMGDTEVENAVEVLNNPLTVSVNTQANIFSGPSPTNNILGGVTLGATLEADGVSEDGAWLRVRQPTGAGWIERAMIDSTDDLSVLPVVTAETQSPMQAFYFRTAFTGASCGEAPSVLSIQSPEGIKVDLNANGAHIRLGSLVALRQIPPGNAMQIMTLEGEAVLEPGTPNEVIVPAGYTTQRCLSDTKDLGVDGESNDREVVDECQWLYPVLFDEEEQALAQVVLNGHNALEPPPVMPTQTCPFGQVVTHTVSDGETLFSIAQRYNTTVNAITYANGLSSTTIYVGQQLVVTCGAGDPPVTVTPVATEDVCIGFRMLSPVDTIPNGTTTLSWTPVPGATGYRVQMYHGYTDQPGQPPTQVQPAGPFDAGNNTSLSFDSLSRSWIQSNYFSFQVEALVPSGSCWSLPVVEVYRESVEVTATPPVDVCDGFTPVAPVETLPNGLVTFSWTPFPGAYNYTLNIYGSDQTTEYHLVSYEDNLLVDTSSFIGNAPNFLWSVTAVDSSGVELCTSESVSLRAAVITTPEPPQRSPVFDCSTFQALSPLDTLSNGVVTFSWTPVDGAIGYRLNLNGALIERDLSFPSFDTSLAVDTTAFEGQAISWTVSAFSDLETEMCVTEPVFLQRSATPDQTPDPRTVDCSLFQAVYPRNTLPYGSVTFSWSPAPGATNYQLNIRGMDSSYQGVYDTGDSTSLTVDTTTNGIGDGSQFVWYVEAQVDGQATGCTTHYHYVTRAPVPEATETPVSIDCSAFRALSPLDTLPAGVVTFSWTDAPGAEGYRLHVINGQGDYELLVDVGLSTSLDVDTSRFSGAPRYMWMVSAYTGRAEVCSTPPTYLSASQTPSLDQVPLLDTTAEVPLLEVTPEATAPDGTVEAPLPDVTIEARGSFDGTPEPPSFDVTPDPFAGLDMTPVPLTPEPSFSDVPPGTGDSGAAERECIATGGTWMVEGTDGPYCAYPST